MKWSIGILTAGLVCLLVAASPLWAQSRISFQIATGSTGGTYFPVGQMLASIISHPPGVGRCQVEGRCGPPGLLAASRATEGSVANARAVSVGRVSSALVQADIAALAFKGEGPFKEQGPLDNLRALANLFPELVHLVVASEANVAKLSDLRRKRISIDGPGSGTNATARRILAAAGLTEKNATFVFENADRAAQMMATGEVDAFFFIGGPPLASIADLIANGDAKLLPIEGKAIDTLMEKESTLRWARIPDGIYPGAPETPTIAVAALWIVSAETPDDVVYEIVRATWNPANRTLLDSGHPVGRLIRPEIATMNVPIPFHPGAARYYADGEPPAER